MKHQYRFFGKRKADLPDAPDAHDVGSWEIDEEEVHHIAKVLRLADKSPIELIDGAGYLARGSLDKEGKKYSFALEEESHVKEDLLQIDLCLGALKPREFDEVVPGLVECGVNRIRLFLSEGTEKSRTAATAIQRWERIVSQSLKQCKRLYRPIVSVSPNLRSCVEAFDDQDFIYVLDPDGATILNPVNDLKQGRVLLVIGSEKGFSENEMTYVQTLNSQSVSLGSSILRAKTAALAGCSIFNAARLHLNS